MPKPRRRKAAAGAASLDDTRTRILDTAERLFAERGVDAVSVRAVLKEAGVNVALAHYHFGSREGLVEELLKSRAAPLAEEQLRAIDEVDARGENASLEEVLRAYFSPAARAAVERPRFGKLFAQLQLSANPAVRELGREALRRVLLRLGEALMKRLPNHLEPRGFLLRFYTVFAIPFYFAAHWDLVMQSARKRLPADALPDETTLTQELVAFCAAGLRAGASRERGK